MVHCHRRQLPEGCTPQWCVLADARGLPSRAPVAMALQHLCRNDGLRGPYLVIAHQTTIGDWLTAFSTWAPSLVVISPPNRSSHAQCDLAPAIERLMPGGSAIYPHPLSVSMLCC